MRAFTLIIIRHRYAAGRACRYIAGRFDTEEEAHAYADLFYAKEPREIEAEALIAPLEVA